LGAGAISSTQKLLVIPPERRPLEFATNEYFHPTFLYESLWNLMVFALVMTLFFRALQGKPRLKVGTLFLTYLPTYSLGRFWIEGFRTDSLMFGPLRMAQVVSLTGIVLGLAGLAWLYLYNRPLPDVVSTPNDEGDREMGG
jgi:phosphatidylglycerol---prolipoprotein diacylglyceryl transferase